MNKFHIPQLRILKKIQTNLLDLIRARKENSQRVPCVLTSRNGDFFLFLKDDFNQRNEPGKVFVACLPLAKLCFFYLPYSLGFLAFDFKDLKCTTLLSNSLISTVFHNVRARIHGQLFFLGKFLLLKRVDSHASCAWKNNLGNGLLT